jgi:hypothetical protein
MRTVAFLLVMLTADPAYAQCPSMHGGGAALRQHTNEERMAFILRRIRGGEEAARTWTTIFAIGYLGLTVGQMAALTATQDPAERIDRGVAAVSSAIGVATIFILPLDVLTDRARVEALAPRAAAGDCAALEEAEDILESDAADEAFGSSWLIHVGSVLFNLGVGLVLGLGYGHWVTAAISTGVGILVGEVQTLTQPTDLIDALVRYRTGDFDGARPSVAISPYADPSAAGVGLRGAF